MVSPTGTQPLIQHSTLGYRRLEEGLEVRSPGRRQSQPGLIVVTGPHVVSPEDKYRKPEIKTWNSEASDQKSTAVEPKREEHIAEEALTRKIWKFRRRTFWILVALAILLMVGVITGIAVAVTRQNKARSTVSDARGGQVSADLPPVIATKTVSFYVASDAASTSTAPSGANTQTSSRQIGSPIASSRTTTPTAIVTAIGEGRTEDAEPATIAVTTTAFIAAQQPPPTEAAGTQPTNVVSATPSPQKTSPPSAPSPTPPHTSSRDCIGGDGSIYTDPGTGRRFRIECAISHQGQDLINREAETMEACVGMCAANPRCRGAVWYNVGPQGTDLNYCWLKSGIDDDVRDTLDAQSVVLL